MGDKNFLSTKNMASKDNNEETKAMDVSTETVNADQDTTNNSSAQSKDPEQSTTVSQSDNSNQNAEQTSSQPEPGDSTQDATQATGDVLTDDAQKQSEPADSGGAEKYGIQETGGANCDSKSEETGETVTFKVIYNKQKFDVTFPLDKTISNLKEHVQTLTGVPSSMQKIMFKGLAKNESTLRDLKVNKGAKLMVVGSTMNDVLQVASKPTQKELEESTKAAASKEAFSQQKQHKKVLDKYGKPDDVTPGIKNTKLSLPPHPLSGMYNKSGGKVRLTFKLELDQLWLGTKERTEKLPMNSIKAVVSEPIVEHEEYHLMALQLGPTEASRYWIYWVPAQYVDAIKDTVLGKWQLF